MLVLGRHTPLCHVASRQQIFVIQQQPQQQPQYTRLCLRLCTGAAAGVAARRDKGWRRVGAGAKPVISIIIIIIVITSVWAPANWSCMQTGDM